MTGPSIPSLAFAIAMLFTSFVTVHALNESRHHLSLVHAPSIRLHVTLHRDSLQLHGHSKFDVFATPVVSANDSKVLYDGYAIFADGGHTYTYSYVRGVGYLSTNDGENEQIECLSSSQLPFNAILHALHDMTPISSASIGDDMVNCTSGNLFKATLDGTEFVTCAAGKSGFTASNSEVTIDVEYLDSPIQVHVPAWSSRLSCDVAATATSIRPTALAWLTGNAVSVSSTRQLEMTNPFHMNTPSCRPCKSKPRPCVFFHGTGNRHEMEELQDTPQKASGRMGNMNKHAPCCTVVKYAILNTLDSSWTDDKLQQKFCDRALRLSKSSDKKRGVIRHTVVVTHSMAGLIMSMALATGKCRFGKGTAWVAISTPMMGSMASDYFQDFCDGKHTAIAKSMLKIIGQCPLPLARSSLVYQNGKHASSKLNRAYRIAQKAYAKNVDAAMCSDNPNGMFSPYEGLMRISAAMVSHMSPQNDGLVEFQSCAVGLKKYKFGKSYKNKFYQPALNHADTAFLSGDGIFKDSQKPIKWFECLL
ncbi:unnamed protein product [Peronospora belbahrii]|uniref:GPI inositol-deacylase n=1 Tax=Peronospora belbahrii TaxID=622444 RepID=A0AAU9L3K5_9STRA|nr:unnamed protein product [Peronospora belbahrii]CAH0521190.1 unnamed protein product [Peronospora belbahrii]